MANLKFPRQRMYWHHVTRVDRIASAMPVNRFQKIRNNILINSAVDTDPGVCNKILENSAFGEVHSQPMPSVNKRRIFFGG